MKEDFRIQIYYDKHCTIYIYPEAVPFRLKEYAVMCPSPYPLDLHLDPQTHFPILLH